MTDKQEIKAAVHEALDERDGIDRAMHHAHHAFIAQLSDELKDKKERREKIKSQVGGWIIISALSGIAYAVWYAFQAFIKKTGN